MAESIKLGPIGKLLRSLFYPERTGGPLGRLDQSDPNVTSLLGDTPGPLGFNDWADPSLHFQATPVASGGLFKAFNGMPIVVGSDQKVKTATPFLTEVSWETEKTDVERWEGKYPYMYLDTKGLVTVGIGRMLPSAKAAKELGFVRRIDQLPATPEEIEKDFNNVHKQPPAMLASNYKNFTTLDLPDPVIYDLLKKIVEECNMELETTLESYKSYPAPAKRAFLDMKYNLSLEKFNKFTNLKAAAKVRDWKTAAAECHRKGPSEERNNWTRDMFLEAAKLQSPTKPQ